MTLLLRDYPTSRLLELHGVKMYEDVQRIRILQMRREWIRDTGTLLKCVTPTMLAEYGLDPWDGLLFGMRCVPSPIILTEER